MSAPVLSRVVYELFPSDVEEIEKPGAELEHTIDREVRLEFSNGDMRFISWCSDPVQYSIAVQERSFFVAGSSAVTRDLSDHPLWRPLIGNVVNMVALDPENQVLEVHSAAGSVYLSSHEGHWYADVVTVSANRPKEIGIDASPVA